MKIWFTSDLHFGHRNIIKYCHRPFDSVDEMDNELIKLWNDTVDEEDEVFVLGDFSLHGKPDYLSYLLHRLKGRKYLVRGNHDHRKAVKKTIGWEWVKELHDASFDGTKVRLFHFPIRDWRGPRILLHGHSHSGKGWSGNYSVDVGVDSWNYRPISLEQILSVRPQLNKRNRQ